MQEALDEIQRLFLRASEAAKTGTKLSADDLRRYRKLKLETARNLPSTPADVLPTDFGNAIRAFEFYSRDIYGADGVWVWLRLATVIPKDVADQIQDSRTQIDFLINCSLYAFVIAVLAFGRVIYAADNRLLPVSPICVWLQAGAAGLVATYLFYRWAVSRVPAWGEWVMTAYDCYLPALAKQLGYELPATEKDRMAFWKAFSQQLIYRRNPDGSLPFHVERWIKPTAEPENAGGPQAIVIAVDLGDDER